MLSSLVPFMVVVGVLCWIVLPAVILLAAAVGPRRPPASPVWVRRCRAWRSADPCWVTAEEEYCPKHEGARLRPEPAGLEIFIN
ncbi:MAG: hypothetical protein M3357_01170 [Actinomycetota bacterium]|nr:hypothetical protein [Actinomycetota bacterium]